MAKGTGTKRPSEDADEQKQEQKPKKNSDIEPPNSELMSRALLLCNKVELISIVFKLDGQVPFPTKMEDQKRVICSR